MAEAMRIVPVKNQWIRDAPVPMQSKGQERDLICSSDCHSLVCLPPTYMQSQLRAGYEICRCCLPPYLISSQLLSSSHYTQVVVTYIDQRVPSQYSSTSITLTSTSLPIPKELFSIPPTHVCPAKLVCWFLAAAHHPLLQNQTKPTSRSVAVTRSESYHMIRPGQGWRASYPSKPQATRPIWGPMVPILQEISRRL